MLGLLCCLGILLFSLDLSAVEGVPGFCESKTEQIAAAEEAVSGSFFDESNALATPKSKKAFLRVAETASTRFDQLQDHLAELAEFHTTTKKDAKKAKNVPRGDYAIADLERLPARQRNKRLANRLSTSAQALREVHVGLQKGGRNMLEIGDIAKYWANKEGRLDGTKDAPHKRFAELVEKNETLLKELYEMETKIRRNVAREVSKDDLKEVRDIHQRQLDGIEFELHEIKSNLGILDSPTLIAKTLPIKPLPIQHTLRTRLAAIRPPIKGLIRPVAMLSVMFGLPGGLLYSVLSHRAYEAEEKEQEEANDRIRSMSLEEFESLTKLGKEDTIKQLVDAQVFLLYKLQHDQEAASDYDKYDINKRKEQSLRALKRGLRVVEYRSGGAISPILEKHGFRGMPEQSLQEIDSNDVINDIDYMRDIVLQGDDSVLRDLLTKVYEFHIQEYSDIQLKTAILRMENKKRDEVDKKVTLERAAAVWLDERRSLDDFNPLSITSDELSIPVPEFPKQKWEGGIDLD